MGILEAEAGQEHFGIAIGPVIVVSIGIEEEIGRLGDENSAMTDRQARCQVQAVDEDCFLVGSAVAVGVFEDLDPVGTPRAARGGLGDAVILGAQVLIDGYWLEARGVGILQVLDDPEPAAVVKVCGQRLPHHRLGCEDFNVKAGRHDHAPDGLFGREASGVFAAGQRPGNHDQCGQDPRPSRGFAHGGRTHIA